MDCPDCGHDRTSVVDTRSGADGTTVRRRRECNRCSFRFTTYERPEWETLQVKKRDGAIEPFDPEKIRRGIDRAVEKRPVTDDEVNRIVDGIRADVRERETRIVSSKLLGELVSERLRETDPVAYIRFVSVYKAFSDPEEFVRELDRVLDAELAESEGLDENASRTGERPGDESHESNAKSGTGGDSGSDTAQDSDRDG
jgi:transcriptional repressor NrdR